jgi:lysophospholipase L1-like esterase
MLASLVPAFGAGQQSVAPSGQEGRILFVGSSIFRRWTNLAKQMDPLPVVNRGVDGFQTFEVLALVDRIVLPAKPRVVVYYAGSNDIDLGEPAEAIVERIRRFVDRVSTALPSTRIVFVSVNRAPQNQELWDVVDAVNRQVAAYAAETRRLEYVDVNPALFNPDGSSRLEFFMPDRRHLRPAAYVEFTRILKPILTRAFQ